MPYFRRSCQSVHRIDIWLDPDLISRRFFRSRARGYPIGAPPRPSHDMFGALNRDLVAQDFREDLKLFATQARTRHCSRADGAVLFQ
jgi:hypothetical protein